MFFLKLVKSMLQSTYSTNKMQIILALTALTLFIVAYIPVFQFLGEKWLVSEEYSHSFIVVPFIFYMAWRKLPVILEGPIRYSIFGLVILIFSIPIYLFAWLTQVHTIISLSLFLTIIGVIIYLAGVKGVKELCTPLILLVMVIPIPEQLYIQITFPLQLKVSQISEIVIRIFGVPIFREGNIMNIPEKSFEVVEACSGLRSMITILTLSVIMDYFMLRKTYSKLVLFIMGVPVAIFVNIIRVISIVLLFHYFKLDLSAGIWHTIMGLLIFCIALLILFLLQRVLEIWEKE